MESCFCKQSIRHRITEILESRYLLSWLTVIAHGQLDSGHEPWLRNMAEGINDAIHDSLPSQTAIDCGVSDSTLRLVSPTHDADAGHLLTIASELNSGYSTSIPNYCSRFLLVDWGAYVEGGLVAPNLADEVGARLGLIVGYVVAKHPEIDSVHFIGFSRGAYVVNTAIGILGGTDTTALQDGDDIEIVQRDNFSFCLKSGQLGPFRAFFKNTNSATFGHSRHI